ncbi:hypothetical protein D1872_326150 [compost metagenome]
MAVAAGCTHTLGLQQNGIMVAVGDNEYGQCDVSGWRGIGLPGNRFGHAAAKYSKENAMGAGQTGLSFFLVFIC